MDEIAIKYPAPASRQWEPFTDGRSKAARTAKVIVQELAAEYATPTALSKRRLTLAAKLLSPAKLTLAEQPNQIRRVTGLVKAAEAQLSHIRRAQAGNGQASADLAREIQHELTAPTEAAR